MPNNAVKLRRKRGSDAKRFCLLRTISLITEEVYIDFHYWYQKKCLSYPILPYMVSFISEIHGHGYKQICNKQFDRLIEDVAQLVVDMMNEC